MSTHVLVPVDGSPLSMRALEVACEERADAEIVALHVVDPTEPGYGIFGVQDEPWSEPRHGSDEWYDQVEEYVDELFDRVEEVADEFDATVRTERRIGRPDREILEFVDEAEVDHVYLGSHGRDTETRLLVGSVTEAVAFRAPVQVTLVR